MRNPRDFYPTPGSITKVLLENLGWEAQPVWEPCCGDGRLGLELCFAGYNPIMHDIESGHDFFDWREAQAPAFLTNPPFNVVREFIDHAFAIGVERMALVCAERIWACGKGWQQWQRHRPSRFINLDWREDYLGKGGSPDRALAISIWDTPHSAKCGYEVWGRKDV